MAKKRYSGAEIVVGVFIVVCFGLFVGMMLYYGKASRMWRGRQDLIAVFTSVTSLRPNAPVRFNGVEVGQVKNIRIIMLDDANRARLPRLTPADMENLPLTDEQRVELRKKPPLPFDADANARARWMQEFHDECLKAIADRTMIELTLEVLSPREELGETRRYRADDQVRITTTLLGDTCVEIASGRARDEPVAGRFLLGVSGDFFTNLSKSVERVKEVLTNVSDVVGPQERESVRKALRRFDTITQRIENIVDVADKRLPATWDKVDALADDAKKDLGVITETVTSVKPPLVRTLDTAEKAVQDLQGRVGALADEARATVTDVRGQVRPILTDLNYITTQSKEDFPQLIRNAGGLASRLRQSADKLDNVLDTGDRLLKESYPDLRRLILALRMGGENFCEATDVIKRKPWLLMAPAKESAFDNPQALAQKLETATKRFRELTTELMAVRRNLPANPTPAQLERLDFLVQELNILCEVLAFAGDMTRKQILPEFTRKPRAFIADAEAAKVENK